MSRIFISYRRSDASADAGRLQDHLSARFGAQLVFQDVLRIDPGQRFAAVIEEALDACDVFLAIIGPSWLSCANPDGGRRLDQADDWVRVETARALARPDITVIPVTVRGARFPKRAELPPDLQPLVDLEFCELDDKKWLRDVEDLIRLLESRLGISVSRPAPRQWWRGWWWKLPLAAIASLLALFLLLLSGLLDGPEAPNVVGKTLAEAREVLETQAGMKLFPHWEDSDQPYGTVLRQHQRREYVLTDEVNVALSRGRPDVSKWVNVRNTGSENAGAAVAMAMAIETLLAAQGRPTPISARYLLEKAKLAATSADSTYLNEVVDVAQKFGAPPEVSWPYRDNQRQLPPATSWQQLDQQAAGYRVKATRIGSFEEIPEHLRKGRPVLAATDFYETPWKRYWDIQPARQDEKPTGRHTILIVRHAHDSFDFANVWGKQWGRQGFGGMTRDAARQMLDLGQMWAIQLAEREAPRSGGR